VLLTTDIHRITERFFIFCLLPVSLWFTLTCRSKKPKYKGRNRSHERRHCLHYGHVPHAFSIPYMYLTPLTFWPSTIVLLMHILFRINKNGSLLASIWNFLLQLKLPTDYRTAGRKRWNTEISYLNFVQNVLYARLVPQIHEHCRESQLESKLPLMTSPFSG